MPSKNWDDKIIPGNDISKTNTKNDIEDINEDFPF
jgi:hypothetical protein